MKITLLLLAVVAFASAQRITTIQLDGVQYFVSRMNPYSPELNYFLAYQYCRSLGLQLASFETKEKADTMTQYLKNAGYTKYDFWTSGNKLGTDMFLWMSTGLPFNATFDYMRKRPGDSPIDVPPGTEPQRVARESGDSGSEEGCVAMKAPTLGWEAHDCTLIKDFICEQTRCYYYNYGSIPVSATQGNRRPYITTTAAPAEEAAPEEEEEEEEEHDDKTPEEKLPSESVPEKVSNDPVVNRLITAGPAPASESESSFYEKQETPIEKDTPSHHIPDIASLFTASPAQKETAFEGLETHEVRPAAPHSNSAQEEAHEVPTDYDAVETELPNNALEDAHTIGPYESVQDYVNDQGGQSDQGEQGDPSAPIKQQDDDSSTILPEAEPAYRYNIKVRSNGKVLDPPSK